jgi:hypothetical protein
MAVRNETLASLAEKIKRPGSREAQDSGCLCPAEENHYGKGREQAGDEVIYTVNEDCPLHRRRQRRRRR